MVSIKEPDLKMLWGLAAGQCSFPGCAESCLMSLGEDPTVIGEMAHVIARKPSGPRGQLTGGTDRYDNLILLCPTHHTIVDKAPAGVYSVQVLRSWKKVHEERVRKALLSPSFSSTLELGSFIKRLMIENKAVWTCYGPEFPQATSNPTSSAAEIWVLRKLATIVPNNRRIVEAIRGNAALFSLKDYSIAAEFLEHAEGFERNCYERSEDIPRFPQAFEALINVFIGSE